MLYERILTNFLESSTPIIFQWRSGFGYTIRIDEIKYCRGFALSECFDFYRASA